MSGLELFTITTAAQAAAAGTPWLAGITAGGAAAGVGTAVTLGDAALAASTLISGAGMIGQANAQRAAGENAARTAQFQSQLANTQAAAMEQQAGQERAASQRAAIAQRRQGNLVSSRARAVAGASGGGALDPTVLDIMSGIDSEVDYRTNLALYEGEERAKGLEYGAVLRRAGGAGDVYAGQVAQQAGRSAANRSLMGAGGKLLEGGARLESRFASRGAGRGASNTLISSGGGLSRYYDLYGDDEHPIGFR